MRGQTVVVGFGVTGASATKQLLRCGVQPADLIVVDVRPAAVAEAMSIDVRGLCGDGTAPGVLERVMSEIISCVIVTAGPDQTAVMITMLARHLRPTAEVVTAVRDDEFVSFARHAGADQVLATSQWTGRALALLLDKH